MPPATPPPVPADAKQAAYDALNALLSLASTAACNRANTQAAQDAAYDVRNAISARLAALDQAVFTGNTITLHASAGEMTLGMDELKALKAKIEAVGKDLKECAAIASGIENAAGKLTALGVV
jgi:hypothetical protein